MIEKRCKVLKVSRYPNDSADIYLRFRVVKADKGLLKTLLDKLIFEKKLKISIKSKILQ